MISRDNKIGGPGHIVEIDESKFGKRKCLKGKRVAGEWIFGGVDRGTKEIFIASVDNRKATTLFPVIQSRILPGTTIYSDCWSVYKKLQENDSGDKSLVFKASLPIHERSNLLYTTYLTEYVYRKWRFADKSNAERFVCFLEDIAKVFPPNTADKTKNEEDYYYDSEDEEEVTAMKYKKELLFCAYRLIFCRRLSVNMQEKVVQVRSYVYSNQLLELMAQIMGAFQERFNKAPPRKATLLEWERLAFAFGSVKDRPRSGRKKTREKDVLESLLR
ncbi:hypothetical protein C0J52_07111 [Blattella germanica]|nr:hypothetical protein C0J52_07111 [Blattella germanica]